MGILDESIARLGELKTHVNRLVQFFNSILVQVKTGVEKDVQDFLSPIKRSAKTNDESGELEGIKIGRPSKMVCHKVI